MQNVIDTCKQIGLITIALTLALVTNFAYGQWANPTAAPTGNNVAVPINIGGDLQNKLGDMGAFTVSASDEMRSDLYCDYAGNNCFAATTTAALVNGGGASTGGDINSCKVCIACSDDGDWNGMVVCDGPDNDGWTSSNYDFCADDGRIALKFVCGTDSYSDSWPNSSP